MFSASDILYEDNHIMVVNKHAGDPVQADKSGDPAIEDQIKAFIKERDKKPFNVYLGVVHRIDRPVAGVVIFSKTSKALARLNETVKERQIKKTYLAITETKPPHQTAELKHYIERNPSKNRSYAYEEPRKNGKEARLTYTLIASSDRYHLLEIDLITGRHHQIRAQLSKIGAIIKGDLKYGATRSNPDGSISLLAYKVEFTHPVSGETVKIKAPLPEDNLWSYFNKLL